MNPLWCSCGAAILWRSNFVIHVSQNWPTWAPQHIEVDKNGNPI